MATMCIPLQCCLGDGERGSGLGVLQKQISSLLESLLVFKSIKNALQTH